MSNVKGNKSVDARSVDISATKFTTEANALIVEITAGEFAASKGYTALAHLCIRTLANLETDYGLRFENISAASSGKFADTVKAMRKSFEAMFANAGYSSPRSAWLKIQTAAKAIRVALDEGSEPTGNLRAPMKPADEFSIEKLIAVYNKAIKTAGEISEVDTARPFVLQALNALGIKSSNKRLNSL
jgi:hypothetical protein